MSPELLFLSFTAVLLFAQSFSLDVGQKTVKNITVIGTVFCDICSNNSFSNHSYFLPGAKVLIECKLRSNTTSKDEISVTIDRTTDRFGVYMLEIPPFLGFECKEGQEPESFCRATLVASSSPMCDVPGLRSSTEHVALKNAEANACLYNLNALSYKPAKRDSTLCGTKVKQVGSSLNSSLFFWPPFWFPWPRWPPFPFPLPPFPFPSPPSLPFPFPPLPLFTPPPPLFPFPPLPPLWPTPNPPPSFPFPLPPLPPAPPLFSPPSPPPPSLPFPLPPLPPFPPFTPIPSLFTPPPPPPSPPPPFLPFPFPPFPPIFPSPRAPSPPPLAF